MDFIMYMKVPFILPITWNTGGNRKYRISANNMMKLLSHNKKRERGTSYKFIKNSNII